MSIAISKVKDRANHIPNLRNTLLPMASINEVADHVASNANIDQKAVKSLCRGAIQAKEMAYCK